MSLFDWLFNRPKRRPTFDQIPDSLRVPLVHAEPVARTPKPPITSRAPVYATRPPDHRHAATNQTPAPTPPDNTAMHIATGVAVALPIIGGMLGSMCAPNPSSPTDTGGGGSW